MNRTILICSIFSSYFASCEAQAAASDTAVPKIMAFDFSFDNSSMEPTTDAERARIKAISDQLRTALQKSGKYDVIPGNSTHFKSVQDVGKCNNDELVAAQKAGAGLVACGLVQKVSNLILNLNLIIENAKTGQQITGGSVDIRGNTDVSWDRGLRYLLSEHILVEH